ncbi:ArsR/SmtB family transcription factor [Streptomyces albus]|uniref:ArsR/SmtB family transcription factor n=1 Tax=Streptomyces TaxID=1883 RepID=UPI00034E7E3C|nr:MULTISPECIES: metalloregulator ArsR/SmtB family transcription factor [Streptomyces]EPD97134.1 hypothetical protein HMPREF1486_00365 [Streptomyces sp. HPH0547]MDI6410433.1 metalloregulator ArsR/SmtB family transcription factor [Streptomyces albus]UVN58313.1 metalloregulator ArsR/SmtB family transcription factor [Streptomyces albus]GHJ20909.1 hypothetical protein TPA0909_25230 [Streptomyces albus]
MTNHQADAAILKTLGHPVRLGIVRALAAQPETCACDFTELFDVSQPTISQHLKVLREAGVVSSRRRGVQICYSVRPEAVSALRALVEELEPVRLADAG